MSNLIVYPRTEHQLSLLQALLQELNIKFELTAVQDETQLSEDAFYARIDRAANQAANGQSHLLPKGKQQEFLGL